MDEAMKRDITDILRFEIECEKYNPKEICKSAKNSLNSQCAIKIKYTNKLNEKKKELKDIMTFDWCNKRDELAKVIQKEKREMEETTGQYIDREYEREVS